MNKYSLKEFLEKKLYFIEFKHQRASYIDSKEIKSKFVKKEQLF